MYRTCYIWIVPRIFFSTKLLFSEMKRSIHQNPQHVQTVLSNRNCVVFQLILTLASPFCQKSKNGGLFSSTGMPIFLSPSLVHLCTHLLPLLLALGGATVCHFPQMAVLNAVSWWSVAPLWCRELSGHPIRVQALAVKKSSQTFHLHSFYTHVIRETLKLKQIEV